MSDHLWGVAKNIEEMTTSFPTKIKLDMFEMANLDPSIDRLFDEVGRLLLNREMCRYMEAGNCPFPTWKLEFRRCSIYLIFHLTRLTYSTRIFCQSIKFNGKFHHQPVSTK